MGKKFDLEDRLISFTVNIIKLAENLPNTRAGAYIANQIIKSGSSPALNYAEAQSAESKNDFIHKMKICLKELRETRVSLKIIITKPLSKNLDELNSLLQECNELIAIFVASISTAKESLKSK